MTDDRLAVKMHSSEARQMRPLVTHRDLFLSSPVKTTPGTADKARLLMTPHLAPVVLRERDRPLRVIAEEAERRLGIRADATTPDVGRKPPRGTHSSRRQLGVHADGGE
ncbi:hypothetical protein GCM10027360_44220 [Amycolatopsis echigonensis]